MVWLQRPRNNQRLAIRSRRRGGVGAGRVDPLDGLVRRGSRAELPAAWQTARVLARLICPASSRGRPRCRPSPRAPKPRGACGEVRLAGGECLGHLVVGAGQGDAFVGAAVAVVRLLDPADVDRRLRSPASHRRLPNGWRSSNGEDSGPNRRNAPGSPSTCSRDTPLGRVGSPGCGSPARWGLTRVWAGDEARLPAVRSEGWGDVEAVARRTRIALAGHPGRRSR